MQGCGVRVALLSYAEVLPAGLRSMRSAAQRSGEVELLEIEPHTLQVVVSVEPRVQVAGVDLDAEVILHRTVYPYRHLVAPALDVLARQGRVVLNDAAAAIASRDKLRTLLALSNAGLPTVPTMGVAAVPSSEHLGAIHAQGPRPMRFVLKPALGAQGRGVVRAGIDDLVGARDWTYAPDLGATLVQPELPSSFDVRAFVVGTWCAVAERRPAAGEWRSNLSLGGSAATVSDPGRRREAETLALAAVAALGLDYGAVDLLQSPSGLLLSEVDAWGGFTGVEEATGSDVAGEILSLARRRAQCRPHA